MTEQKQDKLQNLSLNIPRGIVLTTSFLEGLGYQRSLIHSYKKTGWIESIGTGAYIFKNDDVDYFGALYAIQNDLGMGFHIGGRSALALLGKSQYLNLGTPQISVFSFPKLSVPSWLKSRDWGADISYHYLNSFPFSNPAFYDEFSFYSPLGKTYLVDYSVKTFSVKISNPVLAFFELLSLVHSSDDLQECYEILENLNNLIPSQIQHLLENCSSVKIKRLFLFLANFINHAWFTALDLPNIDLGSGTRKVSSNGIYFGNYDIVVPPAEFCSD